MKEQVRWAFDANLGTFLQTFTTVITVWTANTETGFDTKNSVIKWLLRISPLKHVVGMKRHRLREDKIVARLIISSC